MRTQNHSIFDRIEPNIAVTNLTVVFNKILDVKI